MRPAPGLKVLNDGKGDGVLGAAVGARTYPSAAGIHGVSSSTGAPVLAGVGPTAVLGESSNFGGFGVFGWSDTAIGAVGVGKTSGVLGAGLGQGVSGWCGSEEGPGVHGQGAIGVSGLASVRYEGQDHPPLLIGVRGDIDVWADEGVGVEGHSGSGAGVYGHSEIGYGVWASTETGYALITLGTGPLGGQTLIGGAFYVGPGFPKCALVKLHDGSHRALYSVESPESWFEDFGRGRLVRGKARVRLDRTFAAVVRTGDYHVFLSPEGLSHGLYVSRRTRDGFEVREQHRGTSTVRFSYRIVARRKDVDAPRFKRVNLPALPKLARPKAKPPKISQPKLRVLLNLAGEEKSFTRTRARRRLRGR